MKAVRNLVCFTAFAPISDQALTTGMEITTLAMLLSTGQNTVLDAKLCDMLLVYHALMLTTLQLM